MDELAASFLEVTRRMEELASEMRQLAELRRALLVQMRLQGRTYRTIGREVGLSAPRIQQIIQAQDGNVEGAL